MSIKQKKTQKVIIKTEVAVSNLLAVRALKGGQFWAVFSKWLVALEKHEKRNISFSDDKDWLTKSFKEKEKNSNGLKREMRWFYKVNVL